ncbi:MAG: M48 family metalloprotease, partial [Gallionellaceae bacterium]|nr:M48 family metalloprotease [Gallionellaceae bacterium]
MTKTLFALILAMAASAVQASDPDRTYKDWFKDQKLAMATPPQAAPRQTAPSASSPSSSPVSTERPADQLLHALLSGKVSVEEERRIGDKIAGNFLGAVKLVPDDGLQHYVNLVGSWVAQQSERPDLPWRFGVVDSDDINAFAAPGGYVFVTKGLYRRLANEADLAGVLGHEIGHVIRKHQLKVMQKSQFIALAAGLLGKQVKDENQLIQNLVGNGAEIMSRSLDKEAEFEADR